MAHGFYLGTPLYFDEQGKLTAARGSVDKPERKMACTCFYVDDRGQVWLGWFTRPDHTEHVEMRRPPQLAPDNWSKFLKDKNDLGAAYPVLAPPAGWTPEFVNPDPDNVRIA